MTKKHTLLRWEVSISEFSSEDALLWKVTRRIPDMSVAETLTFVEKKAAVKQYKKWLS